MGQTPKNMNGEELDGAGKDGKYLTFSLSKEEYGIGILKIREIIGMMPITSVPETPHYVRGVINLRGKVIPVIDLRMRFGMAEIERTERNCIIVVEIMLPDRVFPMGVVVDSVSEVLNIKTVDIEDANSFGYGINTQYILGMAKMGNGVKILLDINRVIGDQEIEKLKAAA